MLNLFFLEQVVIVFDNILHSRLYIVILATFFKMTKLINDLRFVSL